MVNEKRRRYNRWRIEQSARAMLGDAGTQNPCVVKDISLKGMQVYTKEKMPQGALFNLALSFEGESSISVGATTVWAREEEENNTYGLYFNRITDTDKEKIYQLVKHVVPSELNRTWWENKQDSQLNQKDRRIFQRVGANIELSMIEPATKQERMLKAVDLGAGGLGLVSAQNIPVHAILELGLKIPDKGSPLYMRGEVVWMNLLTEGGYRVGVHFENTDFLGLSRILRVASKNEL